jgi:hypothetical protein
VKSFKEQREIHNVGGPWVTRKEIFPGLEEGNKNRYRWMAMEGFVLLPKQSLLRSRTLERED